MLGKDVIKELGKFENECKSFAVNDVIFYGKLEKVDEDDFRAKYIVNGVYLLIYHTKKYKLSFDADYSTIFIDKEG